MGLVLSTSEPVPLPSFTTGTPFVLIQIRAPSEIVLEPDPMASLKPAAMVVLLSHWDICCTFASDWLNCYWPCCLFVLWGLYLKIGWVLTCNFGHGNLTSWCVLLFLITNTCSLDEMTKHLVDKWCQTKYVLTSLLRIVLSCSLKVQTS